MTIGDNLHKSLTQAEALKAQLESFGHDTNDQFAKAEFYRMAQAIETQVMPGLKGRVNYVEQQEPQFQVKQQAYQQAQGNQPQ